MGENIPDTFKLFASKADKKEATSKDITKWMTDAGAIGARCSSNNLDIAFTKFKPRGKSTITVKEMQPLIDELAKTYKVDKQIADDDAAKTELKNKLAAAKPKAHGATKTSKTGGVAKMTDTSTYTGSHKERFGEGGEGLGKAGRVDAANTDGYVGGYKNKDTYDKN